MRDDSSLPEVRKDMVPADGSLEGIATSSICGELILCPAQSTYTELSHLRLTAMLLGRFYCITDLHGSKTDSEK